MGLPKGIVLQHEQNGDNCTTYIEYPYTEDEWKVLGERVKAGIEENA